MITSLPPCSFFLFSPNIWCWDFPWLTPQFSLLFSSIHISFLGPSCLQVLNTISMTMSPRFIYPAQSRLEYLPAYSASPLGCLISQTQHVQNSTSDRSKNASDMTKDKRGLSAQQIVADTREEISQQDHCLRCLTVSSSSTYF